MAIGSGVRWLCSLHFVESLWLKSLIIGSGVSVCVCGLFAIFLRDSGTRARGSRSIGLGVCELYSIPTSVLVYSALTIAVCSLFLTLLTSTCCASKQMASLFSHNKLEDQSCHIVLHFSHMR